MPQDIRELRKHLFETIERLKTNDSPQEIERSKAIVNVAGAIIDTARVEVQYLKVTEAADESDFIAPNARDRKPELSERVNGKTLATGKTLGGA